MDERATLFENARAQRSEGPPTIRVFENIAQDRKMLKDRIQDVETQIRDLLNTRDELDQDHQRTIAARENIQGGILPFRPGLPNGPFPAHTHR